MPHELGAVLAVTGLFNLLFFIYPAPLVEAASMPRDRCSEILR